MSSPGGGSLASPGPRDADVPDVAGTQFVGRRWPLFWLSLKTGVLTLLTIGIYRFWMKTRLRRWFWSSIRPAGQPLEYTGLPEEKLLGFLIAVVIMAFYIGIVNLILMFASFALFQGNFAAYLLSFVGVIPLWFFARYRARRYVLARTRWRGLRFGLEHGAWGYAWRAMMHWFITIGSLGLLWPRMTFALEKYRTDRTFFGSQRMHQGGTWTMLYPAFLHIILSVLVLAAMAGVVLRASGDPFIPVLIGIGGAFWLCYGLVHYRVRSLQRMTDTKTIGGTKLQLRAKPLRVLRIYLLGYLVSGLIAVIPMLPLIGTIAYFQVMQTAGSQSTLQQITSLPYWLSLTFGGLLYFTAFILWATLASVFVTLPLIRHYAEGLSLLCPAALAGIAQRDRDEFAEAEGFAEALDVGAAI